MHKEKKKALDAEINDMLLDDIDKFEHFAANNWKGIIIGFFVMFAAVVVVAVGYQVNNSMKAKALNAISAADTKESLEKIVKDYASYPAVNSARIKLALIYINAKNYDKAADLYKIMQSASGIPDEMRWRAALNVSYVMELKGEKEKAAASFVETGAQSLLSEAFKSEANYSAGRIYAELKNNSKASEFLKKAAVSSVAQGAAGFWGNQAKMLLERITLEPTKN
ncbi:MAG: hypothetical protein A2020_05575 [Lentisphaerae bacterium GWF2_45_14]|nr:MAG: hypothetical protein A2020_05575 [Lentisphaerae bacterium GWF2_45_14]